MQILLNENPAYFLMAVIGSTLYIIKMLLLLLAGDGSDGDLSDTGDIDHPDGGEAFAIISVQSILAFFMGTGWIGLACEREYNYENPKAILIATGFGLLMMALSAFLTFRIKKLNSRVQHNPREAVGKIGKAYSTIPAKGKGIGRIEIALNGKQQIVPALSNGEKISAFDSVKVEQVDDSGNLIVFKI